MNMLFKNYCQVCPKPKAIHGTFSSEDKCLIAKHNFEAELKNYASCALSTGEASGYFL